jgi:NAD(P)-dependent dehydrogenase (short-subunit alcohol dehydrogenase family)
MLPLFRWRSACFAPQRKDVFIVVDVVNAYPAEIMSKTVVIGASSGLGRCIGIGLAKRGAQVALLARRRDRIEAAAKDAGSGAVAIECDVTDQASCRSAIAEAADGLGGIDALVYTPGIGPLVRLVDTDADTWRRVLDTNVTGAALATAAAIPYLTASTGKAIYLSSVAGNRTPPWPGLGAYAVSKAALERLVDAWRGEHPGIGFTCLVVGDCAGGEGDAQTEFNVGWDLELASECFPIWTARGYLAAALMPVVDLVDVVDTILRTSASTSMPIVMAGGAASAPT